MGKGGWSAPFSKLVHDSWAARSEQVGSAARAEIVKHNILNGAKRYQLTQPSTQITPMTDQELHDRIVQIIKENGEVFSGYGLVLDGADTVAQLIMNLLIETGRSVPHE